MRLHEFIESLSAKRSLAFRAVQGLILFLRSISLAAAAWISFKIYKVSQSATAPPHPLDLAATLLAVAELIFFAFYRQARARLQALKPLPHRCVNRAERRLLVEQCASAAIRAPLNTEALRASDIAESEQMPPPPHLRSAIEKWFLGATLESISRRDFASWCAWAFFNEDLSGLTPSDRDELEDHINFFQHQVKWRFPNKVAGGDSSQQGVRSIRLSLDPVMDTQRPLVYYAVVGAMFAMGSAAVFALGFRRRSMGRPEAPGGDPPLRVLFRPAKVTPGRAPGRAVVFVHGIGIGFLHYLLLLARLPRGSDVYLVEWPHVCMQVVERVAPIDTTVQDLAMLLRADGHTSHGALFVGHSLGSTLVAWMLHDATARALIKATVLLDPVTFMLIAPGIAFNFLHRKPASPFELLMHFFVSRELFIAHTLSRHFSWSHNVLFPNDDLPSGRTLERISGADAGVAPSVIVLSGDDAIVPARETADYLERCRAERQTQQGKQGQAAQRGGSFEVVWLEGVQHGEVVMHKHHLDMVVGKIEERCV